MQVIPDKVLNSGKLPAEYLRPDFVDYDPEQLQIWREKGTHIRDTVRRAEIRSQQRYYYIGKERLDLKIAQSGTLHFAVNDIVLTRTCIDSMIERNNTLIDQRVGSHVTERLGGTAMRRLAEEIVRLRKECDSLKGFYRLVSGSTSYDANDPKCVAVKYALQRTGDTTRLETLFEDDDTKTRYLARWEGIYGEKLEKIERLLQNDELRDLCSKWRKGNGAALYFGPHPVPLTSGIRFTNQFSPVQYDVKALNALQEEVYPFYNEMTYYREQNYFQAWYDDNVGSFLIVVEKRRM